METENQKKPMDPLTRRVKQRKEELYEKVPLSLKQLDIILWLAGIALAVVIILIALEAAGIYKIGG